MLNVKIKMPSLVVASFLLVLLFCGAGGIYPRISYGVIICNLIWFTSGSLSGGRFLRKNDIKVFTVSSIWLLVPFLCSFYYIDGIGNVKMVLEVLLYISFSIYVCSWLEVKRFHVKDLTTQSVYVWLFITAVFYVMYFFELITYETTFSGVYSNRNLFAIVCTLLTICCLCFLDSKLWKISTVLLLSIFILFTASIKGVIGLLLVIYLYRAKELRISTFFVLCLLCIISGFLVLQTDVLLAQRLASLIDAITSFDLSGMGSASERLWLIVKGSGLASENLGFGIGLNNSKLYLFPPWQLIKAERLGEVLEVGLYTHVNYLEVLLSVGAVGFLAYYLPHIYTLIIAKRKFKYDRRLKFSLVFIIYKLFLDIAMVSYNSFPVVFFCVLSLWYVFNSSGDRYESSN